MATTTTYEDVFSLFKDNITDPDLLKLCDFLQTDTLLALMNKSIAKCNRIVKKTVDLSLGDNELMEFPFTIPGEVMDILIEWMIVFWLTPYVNNIEVLQNSMSTKDFSVFSPANLLEEISNRYELARKHARSLTSEYSYIIGDMARLKS